MEVAALSARYFGDDSACPFNASNKQSIMLV